ncbi:TPA: DUF1542 domain-containing protein [Streptococcus suis]
MNRSKKKSFDWYGARQRFSIRKYHIGAASVLLGMTLVLGTGMIVGAETGVNGDGASNGQIVPGNGTGTSDGTQPQGDNQGVNSSGVQTGNTTNSTANDQSANDTGSASSQPVGTSRSANTGTQGDGTTNQPVDESVIKFPTQDKQAQPDGYQRVEFYSSFAKLDFEGKPGEIEIATRNGKRKGVVFWVKTGTTWGVLKKDPQFRMPKYTVDDGDFILGYDRSVGGKTQHIDFDSLDDTPIVETWQISPTVDYIVGDVSDGKTFEEYMKSGYAQFHIPQFHGITLDANGGTVGGKAKKAFYVAYKHVQWGDQLVTKKIDDASNKASRDGYTFVRWQTATGEGIPTSGQIETIEFTAVWLKHPEEKVAVFDRTNLTTSEKEQVKQKIYDANPDLSTGVPQVIKAIEISDTGEATVTFNDDTAVKVSSTTLTNEDKDAAKSNAKAEIEKDAMEKSAAINDSALTNEEKAAKLADVQDAKDRADIAIDKATTTEDLTKAISDGTAAIEAVSTTSTIKTKAKEALEEAYNAEKAEIENSVLTADEKVAKQAELTTAKEKAIKAVDDATTDSAVEGALNNGKATIESTYTAIIKIPSSASEPAPKGYVTVTFAAANKYAKGFTLGNQTGSSVKVFVKENVKWGTLLDDPAWQWPTVTTDPGDIVVGWAVNISASETSYKNKAFSREKYKDTVVTDTKLYPNVVYEVEEVGSRTKDEYLALYGPDEQDKWIFIKFDAGQGLMTYDKKQYTSRSVAAYFQGIGYDNSQFTSKVVSPTLANHTFVRWQTDAGEVLPKSGKITTDTTYKALYLAHPTDKTVVFDANKLTDTEKDSLKQAINNANTDSANLIQSITVSDTGEAKVTYNDGTVVTVPASHLINEDKEPARNLAKEEIDKASKEKVAEINASALTDEEKAAKLTEVQEAKDRANNAIDNATTTEDLTKALEDGKSEIDAINTTTSPKKAVAKQDLEAAYNAKKDEIENSALTAEEKATKLAELDKAKEDADKAIDAATDNAGVDTALEAGKTAIAGIDTSTSPKKAAAKEELKAAAEDAKKAIDANDNLTDAEKQAAKDAVDAEVAKAEKAIDAATKADEVDAATLAGTKAVAKEELAAAKQDAKNKIDKDVEAANAAIESNPNLSEKEIADAKTEVAKAAEDAKKAIDAATTPEAAQAAEEAGTAAIAADVLDAAKQDAKNKIAKDLATVEAAIDANSNLSQDEKDAAKLAAQAKAAEAVANIEKATTPEAVQTLEDAAVKDLANIEIKAAYDDAVKAIEAADNLSTAAKTQALEDLKKARQAAEDAIKTATTADEVAKGALDGLKSLAKVEAKAAADDAKAAIAQNSNLTDAEKKVYTDAIDKALKDTETKIDAATDADTVDAETVLAQKDIAKQEVAAATADAVKGIEANTNLTDAEKDEYKATVTKAAETAETAIEDATTAADIQSKTFDATQDVAKEEVKADAADAIAGIKANDNLSDTAKEEAIAAIEEARDTTLENIENAKTAAEVDTATLDAEKANAKAEIKAAADDAKKAIDENANLPASDKNALKLAIDAEVAATNLEIDNAKTAEEIDAATLATEKSIAKAEVKAAAEDALQAIDENANLTDDEKAKAKADVYVELSKAEKAIDKATTADAIDNATLVGEKAFATAELEAAADDAKKAIDANTHLTDDQKQAAKDAVDAELAKAKEAVVAAKTADEVETATLVGEKAIAKEEIKAAADDAKKAIDANSNLTDDEKAAAKAAVDTEVAKANEAIDKAATADAVDTATLVGEKAVAKEELKAAADDAKKAIDENANLTDAEKQAAKEAVDAEVAKANEAIDAATKADEVDAATLAGEKAVAKEEVKVAAEDAKKAIDANDNLTDAEKQVAKDAIDAEVAKANEAIDAATKADEVETATLVGEKAVAKEELKAAADDAKKAIEANDNLTDAEKQAAKDAVDAELAKANDAIDAATKADEVGAATLAGEKAVAKEELKAAAEDAKKAIDANPNLSDAEKQAAKDAVDASAAAANKAIDGSTSSVEVQAAKDKGNAAIAENVLDAAKQGAKNKLMEEADKAKAAIDANPNLTPEEKAAAKAEIDKAVEEAIIAINGAGTHHALGEIKLPLSALIKPVVTVTPVLDPNNLTEEEIARIKALLEENNTFPEGTEIIVSKDASVSIKYPDGTIDLVLPAEIVKQADTTAPAITDDAKGNIVVAPTKEAVEFVVTYVDNNGKAQLVVTKGADGKWTTTDKVVIVDPVTGQVIIPGSAIKPGTVVTAYSKDMAGNVSDLNSAEVEAVDANNPAAGVKVKSVTSTSNANKSTKKAKQLPNTGEKATSATSLGLAVLGMGLALFAAKRKKDEEEA